MAENTFFELSRPSDPAVIGVKDGMWQAELIEENFRNYDNYNAYYDFFIRSTRSIRTEIPDFNFDLEYVKIRNDAKLTDFMFFAPGRGYNILISDRLKMLFQDMYLPPHRFFPATIYISITSFGDCNLPGTQIRPLPTVMLSGGCEWACASEEGPSAEESK